MTEKKKRHRKKLPKGLEKKVEPVVVKPKEKLKDMDIHQLMMYYSELANA